MTFPADICTQCGEHLMIHIRDGVVLDPREFHRDEQSELDLAGQKPNGGHR